MKTFSKFILVALIATVFYGCSAKKSDELFNLSADAWYAQIIKDIKNKNFEDADAHYTSFSSEHIASPLLEPMTLILAQANIEEEKYMLANFYLDEYIRRYGTYEKIEYAQFLKIKANYDSFTKPNRNQRLVQNSIVEIKNFLAKYPNTIYRPLVYTMLVKFKLSEYYLNQEIKDLYTRTGRDVSAEIYKDKLDNSPLKDANLIPPHTPWYRVPFE